MMRSVLALFLLLPFFACAQIYQYVDPETGSKKLTNLQPSWYAPDKRNPGPHTLVIVRGSVVDDTSRPVNYAATQQALADEEMRFAEAEEQRLANIAAAAAHATALRNRAVAAERTAAARAAAQARINDAAAAIRHKEALTGKRDYDARKQLRKQTGRKTDDTAILPEFGSGENRRDVEQIRRNSR